MRERFFDVHKTTTRRTHKLTAANRWLRRGHRSASPKRKNATMRILWANHWAAVGPGPSCTNDDGSGSNLRRM